jgi:membrane-bound ClpP family serine protease
MSPIIIFIGGIILMTIHHQVISNHPGIAGFALTVIDTTLLIGGGAIVYSMYQMLCA